MNQGNYSGDGIAKFYKAYVPDVSGDDLELPISFNRFLPDSLPTTVTVRSIYGKIWKMALRKLSGDAEKYVLMKGWNHNLVHTIRILVIRG